MKKQKHVNAGLRSHFDLASLNRDSLSEFKFVGNTPAGGKAYFSALLDVAAVDYGKYINFYHDRIIANGEFAACFSKCVRVENEKQKTR